MSRSLSILAVVGAVAFATNPDDKSFKKFVDGSMKEQGSTWVERKIVSQVASLVYERKDYKFFSLVDIPDEQITYLGLFGVWVKVPTWDDFTQLRQ